jgi:hypothetical protein
VNFVTHPRGPFIDPISLRLEPIGARSAEGFPRRAGGIRKESHSNCTQEMGGPAPIRSEAPIGPANGHQDSTESKDRPQRWSHPAPLTTPPHDSRWETDRTTRLLHEYRPGRPGRHGGEGGSARNRGSDRIAPSFRSLVQDSWACRLVDDHNPSPAIGHTHGEKR